MQEPVLAWVLLVASFVLVATFLPGYLLLRLFPHEDRTSLLQLLVYSVGLSLVVMPLSIYWAGFFGLKITLENLLTVLATVLGLAGVGNLILALKKRREQSQQTKFSENGD
jgi:uncharacterized membrane protein